METINIKGKKYVTVNERLKAFRTQKEFAGWTLKTIAHELTGDVAVMEAQILDKEGRIVANGFAREVRTQASSMVNATSYVENCETSAWGRALGNLGIGIDEAICSAQELLVAMGAQNSVPAATIEQKGNVINPNPKERAKSQENGQQTDDDYFDILADINATADADSLVRLMKSDRVQKSDYKDALLRAGHKYAKEKGWE